MLNHDDFENLLDLHGADLTRWPPHLAARAGMLLGASQRARAAWEDAEMVAQTLTALYPERPARAEDLLTLGHRIAETRQERVFPARLWRARIQLGLRAGALAAALVLGATLGWSVAEQNALALGSDTVELAELDGGVL